jgi:hypothetical protein
VKLSQDKKNNNDFLDGLRSEIQGDQASASAEQKILSFSEHKATQKKALSHYFYKIEDHQNLNRIGNSFLSDYKNGLKNFAFTSTNFIHSQQKTILGLACYFDHFQDNLKIGIVSRNLKEGVFSEIISESRSLVRNIPHLPNTNFFYFQFYHHFEFIDYNELIETGKTLNNQAEYESALDYLLSCYDVIFWDVPEMNNIVKHKAQFFPIAMKFDSLTIVAMRRNDQSKELDDIKNFFQNYGINLKGLIFDNEDKSKTSTDQNKKWWRLFG